MKRWLKPLKNKFISEDTKINHIIGSNKKVYCYDAITKEFITYFDGIKIMQRELNLPYIAFIQRKIYTNKVFNLLKIIKYIHGLLHLNLYKFVLHPIVL